MDLMTPSLLRQLNQLIKDDEVQKFYKWKEYRIIRAKARQRDNNECQMCKADGKQGSYGACHHVKEVRDHPELALTLSNVTIVCKFHHNVLHPEKLNIKPSFTNAEWF